MTVETWEIERLLIGILEIERFTQEWWDNFYLFQDYVDYIQCN